MAKIIDISCNWESVTLGLKCTRTPVMCSVDLVELKQSSQNIYEKQTGQYNNMAERVIMGQ